MLNKRSIIIIVVLMLLLSGGLFMAEKNKYNKMDGDTDMNKQKIEVVADVLTELKNSHPEYSDSQINFYSETAKNGKMVPCEGRDDEDACISAVAFLAGNNNFCGEIDNKGIRLECIDAVLEKRAVEDMSNCDSLNEDMKAICLAGIFPEYQQSDDCSGLKADNIKKTCQGVVLFRMAIINKSKKFCDEIENIFLKGYCLKNVTDKPQVKGALSGG